MNNNAIKEFIGFKARHTAAYAAPDQVISKAPPLMYLAVEAIERDLNLIGNDKEMIEVYISEVTRYFRDTAKIAIPSEIKKIIKKKSQLS